MPDLFTLEDLTVTIPSQREKDEEEKEGEDNEEG
jgi:hypothetical protein|tara:strand:- start:3392 stop:3493 length:102 start_codon:yes stop_codon:yes gene_type:complete